VRAFDDRRIRLIEHSKKQGVLRTFEDAIRNASGDILFLSDQDDLWAENKISTVLRAFERYPDCDLAVSDAVLIDENSAQLADSYYARLGGFHSGWLANVLHCNYLGCTMAFRRRVRDKVLPFPPGTDVFHDLWIGTLNSLTGGKTLYIERPLVRYRRHRTNATGNRRLTLGRQFRIRWNLCLSLAMYYLRWRGKSPVS
jgi:glycosyltransferase involved in cell wall biosynthesis